MRLGFEDAQMWSDKHTTGLTASPKMATFPKAKNGKVGKTLTAQRDIFKPPKH
jgi:hypothetical protein